MNPKYGGLDLAQRVDNSALVVLELDEGVLKQVGQKVWGHIDYSLIFKSLEKINELEKFNKISYDRTGVGDAVSKLIMPSMRKVCRPVVLTIKKKFELITLVKGLFNERKLSIHDRDLFREVTEQEVVTSDAGNLLYRHPQGFHDDRFWALALACDAGSYAVRGITKARAIAASPRETNLESLVMTELNRI